MKINFLLFIICVFSITLNAQNEEVLYCGQVKAREKLFRQHSGAEELANKATAKLNEETQNTEESRGGGLTVYIIPVVFHIIHDNGPENVSDEQIQSALEVLNRDFRKLNMDTSAIVEQFLDVAGDTYIEFRLATIDPNGNCHSGINRVESELTYDGYSNDFKSLSYWPRNSYYNIWVCNSIGDNTAGYAYLPGDVNSPFSADQDGVVLKHNYTGDMGTSNAFRSRTITHETGHWLNLYHTWGPTNSPGDDANCDYDDLVNDTPNCIGATTCNLTMEACSGNELANIQNYMEYSYCSNMFTLGQRTRMRSALQSNTAQRNQLITAANLLETGVTDPPLCLAAFNSVNTSVCEGATVQFTDLSYHNVTQWTWNFGDGSAALSGTDPAVHQNPTHTYANAGTYNVTLTVSNGSDQLSSTTNSFISVFPSNSNAAPFSEGFENTWPGSNWGIYNEGGNETWEVTPTAEFSGDKSLKLRNFNNDISSGHDVLYSTTFDLTGATVAYLEYKWAYANKVAETDDALRISVSGDCGQTWSLRKIRKGLSSLPTSDPINSQFTPTSTTQWDSEIITLTNADWFNPNFRVKFDFEGKGGNNLFLDDINITSDSQVSVNENKTNVLSNVYPNPAEEHMTLELVLLNTENISVMLYDATGKLCQTVQNGLLTSGAHYLNINKPAAGVYVLTITSNRQTTQQKVVFK